MAVEEDDVANAPPPGTIRPHDATQLVITSSATIRTRDNFAFYHVKSAQRFARMLIALEAEHEGKGWGPHWEEAKDYATAAIILSFSAVEAAVNEALDDMSVEGELYVVIEKASTIESAQALLIHCGKERLDQSRDPVQALNLLRAIRNALVHARGEWSDANGLSTKLSKKIVSTGLPLTPFHPDPRWAFPRGIMSAGTAAWAVDTACNFIDEFRSRLDLRNLKLRE